MYHAAASFQLNGLAAAALQDVGVIYSQLPGPWQDLDCCDGEGSLFVEPHGLAAGEDIMIHGNCCGPSAWSWAQSDTTANPVVFHGQGAIPFGNDIVSSASGILSAVKNPQFRNAAGQLLYALTGSGATVYGLFANADGSGIHWETLGSVGATENVTALASNMGNAVYVGTDQGNLYRLQPPYGTASIATQLMIIPPDTNGAPYIRALVEPVPGSAFASIETGGGANGYILSWSGQVWSALQGGLPNDPPFNTMEGQGQATLYAATTTTAYVTRDHGQSWFRVSDGLPAVAQANELHFVTQTDNTSYLYLATYGRSLWRALVAPKGDFSLSVTPPEIRGRSGHFTITVTGLSGFDSPVKLSCNSNDSTFCSISQPVIDGSGTAFLDVTSDLDGENSVTVTATSGAITHSADVTLTVPCKPPRCM
jgi:hypothetical protein